MRPLAATTTAAGTPMPAGPQLAWGEVRHARLRPAVNAFVYPTAFALLPLRSLRARAGRGDRWKAGAAPVSFHHCDHGDGGPDALAWFDALVASEGITDVDGEVWLQTYPRVLGFAFKPVSFWYAHGADGTLRAVLVEVNNTFGERHAYLLHGVDLAWGRTSTARKVFHVSPFCSTQGEYRFRFAHGAPAGGAAQGTRLVARVELHDDDGALIVTSLSGTLAPWTAARAWATFARMPWLTLGVVTRIHWQALALWLKRVPLHHKPAPPQQAVTRVLHDSP